MSFSKSAGLFMMMLLLLPGMDTVSAQDDEFNIRVISDHIYAQHLYRDKLLKDKYRPTFHFVIPEGMAHPFDPNGAFYWKGRYHLFYIFQTVRPKPFYRGDAWAHISSHDLLHWRHHPTALKPTGDTPERAIYSGNMFLDKSGVPTIMYQGLGAGNCIARSAGDDMLDVWIRHQGNPVIPYPEYVLDNDGAEYRTILDRFPDYGPYDVWDPHCWLQGDTYYAISGNNDIWPGSEAFYKSNDLTEWELLGDFFHSNGAENTLDCPDFFKLGDKYVLLFLRNGLEYIVGDFRKEQFYPEKKGTMTWNSGVGYAPESLVDEQGRRIMWAALNDSRTIWGDVDGFITRHAWDGTLTLPRVLTLDKNKDLNFEPIAELQALRTGHIRHSDLVIDKGESRLSNINGNALELKISMVPAGATEFGIKLCSSPDGREETVLSYDASRQKFTVDLSKSSLDEELMGGYYKDNGLIQVADLSLKQNEALNLHIFIDRSVLEVFVNKKLCLTHRIYPTLEDSNGIALFSKDGKIKVPFVDSWRIHPTNPY